MDFDLTLEQEALRDEFRRLLSARCGHAVRLAAAAVRGAVDRHLWSTLAETGVFSLRLPTDDGGLGAGVVEAALVHEELGRAAVPGPAVATAVLASRVAGAAAGSAVVTAVKDGLPPTMIEHLDAAEVVAVIGGDGIRLVDPSALVGEALTRPLDPLTPVHRIVVALPSGQQVADADMGRLICREATLLTAATQVGLGAAATELATVFAKQRVQFGRTIGGFQAVKHLLADALTEVEVARAAVQAAAVGMDEGDSDAALARAVAGARVLASRAAQRATRTCIQVHGGMGYTWELDAHLYLKRALVLDTHFDSPEVALESMAASL